ncbi:hypothetical protein C475_17448 [Halosimplex carlsbadense 2-9-1]|uniref:DUF7344 domain-containing protein n=1 Tax=Halosimplex carlsbadense 2-9-1 TaxID=797114 RepID=M0CGB7_9EURY|nr:hypothetical protein [Halosimplex carlsbadense]ELZ22320.1 hypothetical protein C475_17448 [Halosimplex carlsbadense 2-9-1]
MGSEQPSESRPSDDDRRRGGDPSGSRGKSDASGEDATNPPATERGGRGSVRERPVSVDDLFELLARPGNRYTLAYLSRTEGPVPYGDLVETVVDGAETPAGLSTAEFRDQIATRLVHSNLPKLDDAGLIEYDRETRTVRATEATAVAVPYLELAMDQFSAE